MSGAIPLFYLTRQTDTNSDTNYKSYGIQGFLVRELGYIEYPLPEHVSVVKGSFRVRIGYSSYLSASRSLPPFRTTLIRNPPRAGSPPLVAGKYARLQFLGCTSTPT